MAVSLLPARAPAYRHPKPHYALLPNAYNDSNNLLTSASGAMQKV